MTATVTFENNRLNFSGDLNFQTVDSLCRDSMIFLDMNNPSALTLDFSHVSSVNSGALALIVALKQAAMKKHVTLHFENFPPQLNTLLAISGLEPII